MQPHFENIAQTETGARNGLEAEHKGMKLEVVTATTSRLQLVPPCPRDASGGQKQKLFDVPRQFRANSMDAAFDQGDAMAAQGMTVSRRAAFRRKSKGI